MEDRAAMERRMARRREEMEGSLYALVLISVGIGVVLMVVLQWLR